MFAHSCNIDDLKKYNAPLLRNVIRYYFEETPTGLVHMKKHELMERTG